MRQGAGSGIVLVAVVGALASGNTIVRAEEAAPAMTQRQSVAVQETGTTLQATFSGLTLISSDVAADGSEVTLKFKEAVADQIAKELQARAPNWIAYASSGFDTLLVHTKGPATFDVAPSPRGVTLSVVATPKTAEGGDRIKSVEIRRLTALGETPEARRQLDELRRQNPNDTDLLRGEADIDIADHDNRAAAAKLRKLLRDKPSDEGLTDSLADAEAEISPRVSGGVDYHEIENGDRQWRMHAEAQVPIDPMFDLRGRIEAVNLDDDAVQLPDGTIAAYDGEKLRGQVSLVHDFGTRWEGVATLFVAEDRVGAGGSLTNEDAFSSTTLRAMMSAPSWDYSELIVADGTVDSIAISHRHSFDQRWFLAVDLGLKRYALDGEDDAATSTTIEAGLRWAPFELGETKLTVGYAFDAEYVDHVALRDNGIITYALLPIADRVVHSGDIRVDAPLGSNFFAGGYAGYAKDVNGDGGLIAGATLGYEPEPDIRIALDANYSDIPDRAGDSGAYTHAELSVTKRFANDEGSSGD